MDLKEERIIQECIAERCQLSIMRAGFDDQAICAIPVYRSSSLLLLEYVYDFEIDGFKVLPINTISSVNRGDIERYHDEIFKKEGLQVKVDKVKTMPIDSWSAFFSAIKSREKVIDISLEQEEEFYVGRVITVSDYCIELLEISPVGEWKRECTVIYFKKITMVSFQNRYSLMLGKYCT